VLDFTIAGMDGNAVAQVLTKEQPELPVVACCGCLDAMPESLKWYADALLEKNEGPEASSDRRKTH
jgi:FixJ family two-component response regulator